MMKKVVCIDIPEEDASTHIDTVLADHGYKVVHTRQTETAVQAVRRETPDIVLIDLSDSDQTVWDIYHQIKESTLTCNIPVIIISAKMTRIEDIRRLYTANAAEYLIKPFAPQELLSSIKQILLN